MFNKICNYIDSKKDSFFSIFKSSNQLKVLQKNKFNIYVIYNVLYILIN